MPVDHKTDKRYSAQELTEFKAIIDQKLVKAEDALKFILSQIEAVTEAGSEGDYIDDSSNSTDLNMLYTMEERHRKHIGELNNALLRIKNNTYGICMATGVLIDKKRLLAVPTTTMSLAAKKVQYDPVKRPERQIESEEKPKSIVKVKKKLQKKTSKKAVDPDKEVDEALGAKLINDDNLLESNLDVDLEKLGDG